MCGRFDVEVPPRWMPWPADRHDRSTSTSNIEAIPDLRLATALPHRAVLHGVDFLLDLAAARALAEHFVLCVPLDAPPMNV
jgi:hypothetical protein